MESQTSCNGGSNEAFVSPTLVSQLSNLENQNSWGVGRLPAPLFGGGALTHGLKAKPGVPQLVGHSPALLSALRKLPTLAQYDVSILLAGETGTGKEICARAIHSLSPRASYPFVAINCGALPVELVENELFGHVRGAFTDATTTQMGMIQEAEGGTLFLDEIDCLPPLAQVKLLRFLQEREYRPLGAAKARQANVRLVAATNADLEEVVRAGKLRRDLYYRLNVISLVLPPLRERREDIPLLARHFLAQYAAAFAKPVTAFSDGALQRLVRYEWPGNVRELEHVVERAVILAEQAVISLEDIVLSQEEVPVCSESFQDAKARAIAHFERNYLQGMLAVYQGNITRAAQAAGQHRQAFWRLVHKHGIAARTFRAAAI